MGCSFHLYPVTWLPFFNCILSWLRCDCNSSAHSMISPSEGMSHVQVTSRPGFPNSRDQELISHGKEIGESIPLPLLPSSTSQEEGGEGIASFPLFSVLLPVKDILPVTSWEKRCPGRAHGQGAGRDAACLPRVRVTCRKEAEHKSTYQLLQGAVRSVVPRLHLVLN